MWSEVSELTIAVDALPVDLMVSASSLSATEVRVIMSELTVLTGEYRASTIMARASTNA